MNPTYTYYKWNNPAPGRLPFCVTRISEQGSQHIFSSAAGFSHAETGSNFMPSNNYTPIAATEAEWNEQKAGLLNYIINKF